MELYEEKHSPKQRRKSKLSPHRSIVTTWLVKDKQAPNKQQHTAKRAYDRLKELYGHEFDASERAVRKFVADIHKAWVCLATEKCINRQLFYADGTCQLYLVLSSIHSFFQSEAVTSKC